MFAQRYPAVVRLGFTGDTGNGYRSYEMLEELSKFKGKYGYDVVLMPLAPGHAFNNTDARIAHVNKVLTATKNKTRVYGAREIAEVLRLASDPRVSKKYKYMERSWVFFVVVGGDNEDASAGAGAAPPSPVNGDEVEYEEVTDAYEEAVSEFGGTIGAMTLHYPATEVLTVL